jgi:hypothetical protein
MEQKENNMADNNVISPAKSPSDTQVVLGPDKKYYSFKKSRSPEYINGYFTKKGWQLKEGKWYTANGESADSLTKVGSKPPDTAGDLVKKKEQLSKLNHLETDVALAGVAAAPSAFAMVGGLLRGAPGAALGGALGEGIKDYVKSDILDKQITPQQYAKDTSIEGVKQFLFQKSGEKVGEVFFNQLNKLPHAVTKKGIPLLPGDLSPNSKLSKYVEDLLSNLAPSSKIMGDFRAKQNEAIIKQTTKLANGFAKFNGTSEEMGVLLRNTLRQNEATAAKNLEAVRKSLPAGKQTMNYLKKTQEYKDYIATFDYELMRSILRTNKPELIAGFLRSSKASLGETRMLTDYIHEIDPKILGKVQNTIIRDVINETMTGSKDPMMKQTLAITKNFSGNKFKDILDGIGEQKLKALYGQKSYNAIEDFSKLIAHVDKTQGGGIGKFLNLTFLLPFRSGMTAKGIGKVTGMGIIANRAAKIITSEEGVKLYENYIRATSSQAPRLISAARDELIAFNEKADKEYELDQQIADDEYKATLPKMNSMSFGSETWRQTVLNNK